MNGATETAIRRHDDDVRRMIASLVEGRMSALCDLSGTDTAFIHFSDYVAAMRRDTGIYFAFRFEIRVY